MNATSLEWEEVDLAADAEKWDAFQSRALSTAFHRAAWLRAAEEASGFHLRPLVVREGGGWAATFPVFEARRGPFRICMSPPPGLGIPFLGPSVWVPLGSRPSHTEGFWRQLVRSSVERVDQRGRHHLTRIILSPHFQDLRPFLWSGFRSTPKYRYAIDLRPTPEAILASFQQEARKWIRRATGELTFREGALPEALSIVRGTGRRYEEQGRSYGVTPTFIKDLFESVPSGSLRSFVVERSGTFVTGLMVVTEDRFVRLWQGGHRPEAEEPGATEFLFWSTMLWAREQGHHTFEILGANTPQLVRFKLKFNPELRAHYLVERSTRLANLAMHARHRRLGKSEEVARWTTLDE